MAAKAEKTFKGTGKSRKPIEVPIESDEKIMALGTVSGMTTLTFLKGVSSEDASEQLAAIHLYLDKSFDKENKKKFLEIVDDPDNNYELSDLAEIMSWLVEKRSDDKSFEESSE